MNTNRGVEMCGQSEIAELHEIYQEMDSEGRKKMTTAAAQLLKAQQSFEETSDNAQSPEQKAKKE